MAGRSDIKAGAAYVELFVKNAALIKGLNAAKARLQSFGASLQGIGGGIAAGGAAVLAPLGLAIKHFVDTGSTLADMSARTGVSAQALAELGYAAAQTGTDLETVEKAIRTMQKNGFSADQFDEIAASISAIQDPAERTRKAMEVFGKSGAELLPMLSDLAAMRQRARDLGIGASPEEIAAADQLGDTWDDIKTSIAAAAFKIGSALAPLLQPILDTTVQIAVAVGKWVRENGQLFRWIAIIAAGMVAIGTIVAAIATGFVVLGAVFGGIAAAVSIIGSLIAAWPIVLIVAAVAALVAGIATGVYYWLAFTESGKAAWAALLEAAKPYIEIVGTAFRGIVDAFRSGDLELAASIAFSGVKALALEMTAGVLGAIESMIQATLRLFADAWNMLPDWIKGEKDWKASKPSMVGNLAKGFRDSAAMERGKLGELAGKAAAQAAKPISKGDTRDNYALPGKGGAVGPGRLGGMVTGYTAAALVMAGGVVGVRGKSAEDRTAKATEEAAQLLKDIKAKINVPEVG